jgi:hypothetical protein
MHKMKREKKSAKKELRKDTAFLAKQKSVEIRERFVYLSYLEEFVCMSFCLSVCLSVHLSLSLSYKNGAKKGHRVLAQTEVCGDTREVCIFVLL